MKINLHFLLLVLLTIVLGASCARISSPDGGPIDETPPKMVASNPSIGQINFTSNSLSIEFDEWVKVRNLETELIITPSVESTFKNRINKRTLTLEFKEDNPWQPNTTYNLNFGNTVLDITNNNPAENLSLTFSTGDFIDSLQVGGRIKNTYSQEYIENAVVALYRVSDSTDILEGSPPYITRTDTAGAYTIKNLPPNDYLIYALVDKNQNLQADTESELYGFHPDTISLSADNPIESQIDFDLQRLNTDSLRVLSSRPYGKYYDITFNKPILDFELILPGDSTLYYNQTQQGSVRIYNHDKKYGDSTDVILVARDSLYNQFTDTLNVYFNESRLQADPFTVSVLPRSNEFPPTTQFEIQFTKPVLDYNYDSLYFRIDSLTTIQIPDSSLIWNELNDNLTWEMNIADYLEEGEQMQLNLRSAAFVSVDGDTSLIQQKTVRRYLTEDTGIIKGSVNTNAENYIIQLLDASSLEVLQQQLNSPNYEFTYLDAGRYSIRLILDLDNDGEWDIGNIVTKQPTEPSTIFVEPTTNSSVIILRKNWEMSEINLSLNVDN